MRLKSIRTANYRTLHNLTLGFSRNYCTISGRNNAGKSCVIRLLSALFRAGPRYPWQVAENGFDYKEDKTQWVKDADSIYASFDLEITRGEDPALISFIEKIASKKIDKESVVLAVSYTISENDDVTASITVDGEKVDDKAAKEIDKRIKDSNLLFLYNSTTRKISFLGADVDACSTSSLCLTTSGRHLKKRESTLSVVCVSLQRITRRG